MPCTQPGNQRRVLTRGVADGFQRDGGSAQRSVSRRSGIFGQELPRETETSGGGDSRKRDGLDQGVGRALARLAASRSARDSGWQTFGGRGNGPACWEGLIQGLEK